MAEKDIGDSVSAATTEPSRVSTVPITSHHVPSVSLPTPSHQKRPVARNHVASRDAVQHAGGPGHRVDVRPLQEDSQALRVDNDRFRALIVERVSGQPTSPGGTILLSRIP